VKGTPGDEARIDFCDEVWKSHLGYCRYNVATCVKRDAPEYVMVSSTRHVSGVVRVLPGPATHPDIPVLPPLAKAYAEPPSVESAGIHFEASGAVVRPGSRDVPVDVFVTSKQEFTGFTISIAYPAEHLAVTRVEGPGGYRIDSETGHVAGAFLHSRRRLGGEGERVRLATLYFDVGEGAPDVVSPSFADVMVGGIRYMNALVIWHTEGETVLREATTEVEPIVLEAEALRVQRVGTPLGDANYDGALTMADAMRVLEWLFRGGDAPDCPRAADSNEDQSIDLSDAILILQELFVGVGRISGRSVFCMGE
jgi:hypothetical protein